MNSTQIRRRCEAVESRLRELELDKLRLCEELENLRERCKHLSGLERRGRRLQNTCVDCGKSF